MTAEDANHTSAVDHYDDPVLAPGEHHYYRNRGQRYGRRQRVGREELQRMEDVVRPVVDAVRLNRIKTVCRSSHSRQGTR